MSLHIDNGCLLFVGYSNKCDYPVNGILISSTSGKSLLPESILNDQFLSVAPSAPSLLLGDQVLRRVLDDDDFNKIKEYQNVCNLEQFPASSLRTCALSLNPADWENRVLTYLYEVGELLSSVPKVPFMFFVGECGPYNKRHGLTSAITRSYEGEMNSPTQSKYPGKIQFPEKTYYGGMMKSSPNGPGHSDFVNGFSFYGNFSHGMMSDGMYGREGQYQIISKWRNGFREGHSIEEYNGSLFIGKLKEYKRVGMGVKLMANGSVAVGYWNDNQLDRVIMSLSHVGSVYGGEIRNNVYKGYGEMFYNNYTFYHGMWDGGQYHGDGRIDIERPGYKRSFRCNWVHGVPTYLTPSISIKKSPDSDDQDPYSAQTSDGTREVSLPI